MTRKTPMTKSGAEKLRVELERLKRVERPRITQAIAEARAHGDLKENAEYHAAREQQGMVEARIKKIESDLGHSEIIDITTLTNTGKVVFGSTVELINIETDESIMYQIVGEAEAEIKYGRISYLSPIARAVIGKSTGDEVEVTTPGGIVEYEIGAVKYV